MDRRLILLAMAVSPLIAKQPPDLPETALLAPAHSCTFCGKERAGRAALNASFLIWQSKEWGLEFASKSLTDSDPASNQQTFRQKLFIPDFSWSPGCKVDLGCRLPHDAWDMYGRWTYYHGDFTNLKKRFNSRIDPTGYGVVPLWHYPFIFFSSPPSSPLRFTNASANWKLFFNSVDLDLGRTFTPVKSLIFRMHTGAKGAWLRQQYHVEYSDGSVISGVIPAAAAVQSLRYLQSNMAYRSYSWGLGPRGGLESKWNFGYGFSLSGDAGLSVLCSYFKLHSSYSDRLYNLTADENRNDDLHMKDHLWLLAPVFEGTIGINWGHCFRWNKSPVFMGMSIAYEVQYWWSQNHAQRNFAFQAPGNMWDMRGDLQMHGLTATLRTDF